MHKGIICFETGEFEKYQTCDQFAALPLLEFLQKQREIDDFIYRQIVTREELAYYLKKIGGQHFHNKFDIVYFSFHGAAGNLCLLQNGTDHITLYELAEMGIKYDSFRDRHIHFSACEILNCDDSLIQRFKKTVGAKTVSGYTKCEDSTPAFINELAYFHQIIKYSTTATIRKHMSEYHKELGKLGFKII